MVKPNSLSKKPRKRAAVKPAPALETGGDPGSGDTEKRILAAARKEFIAKGLEGARMQAVATEAGVNKALLHYYFRSKDKLYQKVLEDTISTVWGKLQAEFRAQPQTAGVEGIVRTIVSTYIRTLAANPDFPLFVFREIAGGGGSFPFVLQELLRNFRDVPATLVKTLQDEAKAGLIKPVHPLHFIMNLMGMTVTTFLAMPMLQRLGPAVGLKIEFNDAFLEERIASITDTLLNGIRTKR
ncbi:MAG: TetR/AcrR family transcriptional regulator [Fibrobacteres bacterium]|nr:TetR/AcrR family transcriptional regulator [Fibrobacterota bacterium]